MGSRREVITLAFVALVAAACSSASSGGGDTTAFGSASRPPTATGSSGGATGSTSASPPSSLPGCPGKRIDDPVFELTEATLRASSLGIYRVCGGDTAGLEIRLDPDTDRLMTYRLDPRFVRNGSEGWFEITSCNSDECVTVWHLDGEERQLRLRLWTDPVALETTDETSFEGLQEWVRVAD